VEITREEALDELELLATKKRFKLTPGEASALDVAIKVLEQKPCEDAISRADAIDLFGHGREWTEQEAQEAIRSLPPVRSICQRQQNDVPDTNVGRMDCKDAISRRAVKEQMIKYGFHAPDMTVTEFVEDLQPVNPQQKTGHCKDCKWWKDSDGSFRRGIGAESKCPMNRIEVYEGNGYCFMFEPRESEE
jgi:hypothetical protein